nr:zinc ribbon domain-containing protein [Candidatus Sigynarchaeota archaeon]
MASELPRGGHLTALFVKSWEIHLKHVNVSFFPYFLLGASIGCVNLILFPLVSGILLDPALVYLLSEVFVLSIAFARSAVILFVIRGIDKNMQATKDNTKGTGGGGNGETRGKTTAFLMIVLINYTTSPRLATGLGPSVLIFLMVWLFMFIILAKLILVFILVVKPPSRASKETRGISAILQEADVLIEGWWGIAFLLLLVNMLISNASISMGDMLGTALLEEMPGMISLIMYIVIIACVNGLLGGIFATTTIVLYYKCMADKGRVAREAMPPVLDILHVPRYAPPTRENEDERDEPAMDETGDDDDSVIIANTCPRCGGTVPIYKEACPSCSASIHRCPRCSATVDAPHESCKQCGFKLDDGEKENRSI